MAYVQHRDESREHRTGRRLHAGWHPFVHPDRRLLRQRLPGSRHRSTDYSQVANIQLPTGYGWGSGPAMNPAGTLFYMPQWGASKLQVLDVLPSSATYHKVVASFSVGGEAHAIAFDPQGTTRMLRSTRAAWPSWRRTRRRRNTTRPLPRSPAPDPTTMSTPSRCPWTVDSPTLRQGP